MSLFLDVSSGADLSFQQNHQQVPQILLFLLLSVLAALGAPPTGSMRSSGTRCTFSDQQYEINQTWYRHLKTPSIDVCVQCTCKPDGSFTKMNCSNVTCSKEMCENFLKSECCDNCYDSTSATEKALFPENDSRLPCLHGGRIFQDGDEFTSNATGLQAQKSNQCVHCKCQAGQVMCRLRNCESAQCFTPDCCTTCKDEPNSEEANQPNPVLVTIMVSDSQSESGDCTAAGVTYSHGSSWHPIIGPFGPMDCVYCKCQNGKIECSRLKCPAVQKSECRKPIQVPGHCCPLCIAGDQGASSEDDIQPSLHEPAISVTMAQKGTHQVKEEATSSDSIVDCLPPQTNTIVFRSHAASSSSAYYQYAFQSVNGDHSTRLLTWTVKDGRTGDFSEQHLSKDEFKTLMGTFQFKQQGATRTKFMEKFIRKAKRLPERCGNRCATKIQHLGQVLHLKEVVKRQQCLAQETSFH